MKAMHHIKIGIKNDNEFFDELKELAGRIDAGWLPEQPVERLYFDDLPALLKHLHRQYRNAFNDVKTMEQLGLVEKDVGGHFYVPWDEIDATFRLAA